jgi:hypothetical protein
MRSIDLDLIFVQECLINTKSAHAVLWTQLIL